MLTYVYLGTNDLARASAFYDAVLAPLGMQRCITGDAQWDRISAGWGTYEQDGERELALWVGVPFDGRAASSGNGTMVAFRARSWKQVERFPRRRARQRRDFGRGSRTATALQPGFLCGVRARPGRQQAGCRLPWIHAITVIARGRCRSWDRDQCNAPNTLETIALPAAAGFCRIACSSSPIIRYRPSSAFVVTYCSTLAASPLMRPSLAPWPAN